jgi:hypothetical protein
MGRNKNSLCQRTTLCQKFPTHFEEKIAAFQQQVTELHKTNEYIVSEIGNADEMPVYTNMLSNYTANIIRSKSVVMKTACTKNMHITVMMVI